MPSVWIEFVPADWRGTEAISSLLYDVLYRDFHVAEDGAWAHEGPHGALAVATADDGTVFGTVRLLGGAGDASRQLRQLAVTPHARRLGLGRALVCAVEEIAAVEGATSIWLNARNNAYDFYERVGYRFDGEEFASELTRIPHRRMIKELSSWRCSACRRNRSGIWVPTAAE